MSKYIVTGGFYTSSMQRVTQYSVTGEATELPDLTYGRRYHACSSFINNEGVEVREWASHDGNKNVFDLCVHHFLHLLNWLRMGQSVQPEMQFIVFISQGTIGYQYRNHHCLDSACYWRS